MARLPSPTSLLDVKHILIDSDPKIYETSSSSSHHSMVTTVGNCWKLMRSADDAYTLLACNVAAADDDGDDGDDNDDGDDDDDDGDDDFDVLPDGSLQ